MIRVPASKSAVQLDSFPSLVNCVTVDKIPNLPEPQSLLQNDTDPLRDVGKME